MKKTLFILLTVLHSFSCATEQATPNQSPIQEETAIDIEPTTEALEKPEPIGRAASYGAQESLVSNKTWRRLGLITAGVVVAVLSIYAVNQDQGQEVYR